MFQAIRKEYSLDSKLPKKAEAQLSDLFFLLYIFYIGTLRRIPITKYGINKCIADIFLALEKEGKLDNIKVFNVPLYKHQYGHCNEIIEKKYINELLRAGLLKVKESPNHSYDISEEAFNLIEKFNSSEENTKKKWVEKQIINFIEKYLKAFDFGIIKNSFHGQKIIDIDGKIKTVHDLPIDKTEAIAYNSSPENFSKLEEGRISDIIPTKFLTALSILLEAKEVEPEITIEEKKDLEKMLSCK